ncbi:DUF4404 family protein [Lentisalinibacter sediminis]|uniref:DUF4404 family protein n=1 Tax=Lentisalinibacter sediminis TaxID=2992237 RepID=UPI0038662127
MKDHLRTLHRELEGSGQLDEDMRRLLTQVDEDIHRLLDQGEEPAAEPEGDDALSNQVRETATNFQAEHPRTYRVLREIADTLAKLGI